MNPFKKIGSDDIVLEISKGEVVFSFVFGDRQEKELNLAAGRIHRKVTAGVGSWKLEGTVLSTTYDLSRLENSKISFKEITELFEEMVK